MQSTVLFKFWLQVLPLALLMSASGCAPLFEPAKKPAPDVAKFATNPLPPEKAKEAIEEVGKGFIYGPGLGEAVVNGGTAVLFPPYALVLLGNAVLSLSGYEPVTVSRMLPEGAGKFWGDAYDGVVSGPGRVSAALAGEEFRSKELVDSSIISIFESADVQQAKAPSAHNSGIPPRPRFETAPALTQEVAGGDLTGAKISLESAYERKVFDSPTTTFDTPLVSTYGRVKPSNGSVRD